MLYRIENYLKRKSKNYFQAYVDVKLPHELVGEAAYGGFLLNTQLLDEDSIIYSFGIGENISFDLTLIERFNCEVFGFDPTPLSINWIEGQKLPSRFHFYPFGISDSDGQETFYLSNIKEDISASIVVHEYTSSKTAISVPMKTLPTIIKELGHRKIDVLKLDIEGSEYKVIKDILKYDINIKQITVEFHDRFFNWGECKSYKIISKLKKNGFLLYAISDTKMEYSFIHRSALNDRVDNSS